MKIYITNMRESVDRRRHMQRECNRENLDYSFFDCIVGNELSEAEISEKCDMETINRYNKRLHWFNRGVIGCTLTNQCIYRDIISNNYPYALYLEDDIKFNSGFKNLLNSIEPLIQNGDVILLNYQTKGELRLKHFFDFGYKDYGLYQVANSEVVGGGAAFIVTKAAAEKMLQFNTPVRITPDCWGDFLKANAIDRLFCVYPKPVEGIFIQSTMQLGKFLKLRNFINQYKIFPFYNLIRLYKRFRSRDRYKVIILDN